MVEDEASPASYVEQNFYHLLAQLMVNIHLEPFFLLQEPSLSWALPTSKSRGQECRKEREFPLFFRE